MELDLPVIIAVTTYSLNRRLLNLVLVQEKSNAPLQIAYKQAVMGSEEENAVRYASGYVAMKLRKEYLKQDTMKAATFVDCLSHMAVVREESNFYLYTSEWIKTVDRGGLFHLNDSSFHFFRAVELVTQKHLPQHLQCTSGSKKETFYSKIIEDEDVQFYWSMFAVNIESEESSELLRAIVQLWVTIRGFATTSAWMEDYKRASQKTTKAKKGLRKQLHQSAEN